MKFSTTIAVALSAMSVAHAWEETCTQFKDIYEDGTALCETMWDDSFEVVDDSQPGYTMWFFDHDNNPNEDVTNEIFGDFQQPAECHLNYFHKKLPSAEDDAMTECHPWKNNACCKSETVKSAEALNTGYGPGFQWDRCGPMSDACQRFFVQEACLYECEPAAGLYRKFDDSQSNEEGYNEWQMHKMPIKKSYCNAWYDACKNDYFCGQGSYFGCEAFYQEKEEKAKEEAIFAAARAGNEKSSVGLVIGLSIAGALAMAGVIFSLFLIGKEKDGKPVFAPFEPSQDAISS